MSHMNELCLTWRRHVALASVVSHMNDLCLTWMPHVPQGPDMHQSCRTEIRFTWMSHVPKNKMRHMNESSLTGSRTSHCVHIPGVETWIQVEIRKKSARHRIYYTQLLLRWFLRNFASLDLKHDHVKHLLKILKSQIATKCTTHKSYSADFWEILQASITRVTTLSTTGPS